MRAVGLARRGSVPSLSAKRTLGSKEGTMKLTIEDHNFCHYPRGRESLAKGEGRIELH